MTSNVEFSISDYDRTDGQERALEAKSKSCKSDCTARYEKKLKDLREANRGIKTDDNGTVYFDYMQFACYLKKRFTVIMYGGNPAVYNRKTGVYEYLSEDTIKNFFFEVLKECKTKVWSISKERLYYTCFMRNVTQYKSIEPNPNLLFFTNGTLDISSMKFSPHDEKNIAFAQLPYEYNPTAKAPIFEQTVADIFNHDNSVIKVLQEAFGYSLYYGKHYPLQKIFIFRGNGRNGKSIIAECLRNMLGHQNCSSTNIDDFQKSFGMQDIEGKYVNISEEKGMTKALDTSAFKAITGGDEIQVEKKYQNSYSTKVYTKLFLLTNYPIVVNDASFAFMNRLVIFKFDNQYIELPPNSKPKAGVKYMDKDLSVKLQAETQGIFNWALQGLIRLMKNNWCLTESESIQNNVAHEYYHSNPVRHFYDCCIQKNVNGKVKTSDIHKDFIRWASTNHIEPFDITKNSRRFHELFRECLKGDGLQFKPVKSSEYYYKGISLMNGWINITKWQ